MSWKMSGLNSKRCSNALYEISRYNFAEKKKEITMAEDSVDVCRKPTICENLIKLKIQKCLNTDQNMAQKAQYWY